MPSPKAGDENRLPPILHHLMADDRPASRDPSRRGSRVPSRRESRRVSTEDEGDESKRRKSRRLTLKDLLEAQENIIAATGTEKADMSNKTADRTLAALQATAVFINMQEDESSSSATSLEELEEDQFENEMINKPGVRTTFEELELSPPRAHETSKRRNSKSNLRNTIFEVEDPLEQKKGSFKHQEPKFIGQRTKKEEQGAAVDKRLLMMRNARLIQQVLQEIKDEPTKCHDKWLKRKAASEKPHREATPSSSTSGHRLSIGMKPIEERAEVDAKKIAARLRRKRGQKIRQRLNMLHPDVAEAVSHFHFESWTSSLSTGANLSTTVKERHLKQSRRTFAVVSPQGSPILQGFDSSSSSSEGLSTGSSRASEADEDTSEHASESSIEEEEQQEEEDQKLPLPRLEEESPGPAVASVRKPHPPPPRTAVRPSRVWTTPAMSRRRMALHCSELASMSPGSDADPAEELQPLALSMVAAPFSVEGQRPATTPVKQRETFSWMMQEVERHRILLTLATEDLLEYVAAAKDEGKLEDSEDAKISSLRSTLRSQMESKGQMETSSKFDSNESHKSKKKVTMKVTIGSEQGIAGQKRRSKKGVQIASPSEPSSPRSPRMSKVLTRKGSGSLSVTLSAGRKASSIVEHADALLGRRSIVLAVKKNKLPEVPRLRNRFRDQRFILSNNFRNRAHTLKRYHQQVSERLGLDDEDWSELLSIYHVEVRDMIEAARQRSVRKQHKAATLIQALWKGRLVLRCSHKRLLHRKERYVKIQRWWRRMMYWKLPLKRRIKVERPNWNKAATRIQARFRGLTMRRRLQFLQECHHIKWEMDCLTKKLDNSDVIKVARLQAAARGWLLRRSMTMPTPRPTQRQTLAAPTCILVPANDSANAEPAGTLRERRRSSLFIHPTANMDLRRGTMQHMISPRYGATGKRVSMRRGSEIGDRRHSLYQSSPPGAQGADGPEQANASDQPLDAEEGSALAVALTQRSMPTSASAPYNPYTNLKESHLGKAACGSLARRRWQVLKRGTALMAGLSTTAGRRPSVLASPYAAALQRASKTALAPEANSGVASQAQDTISERTARRSICVADPLLPAVLE